MSRTREQILEARRRLRVEYGNLFDSVAALLFRHDPVGINFDENTDEYQPEAETILPRLRALATLPRMCSVSCMRSLCAGSMPALLVAWSVTARSLPRFGVYGSSIGIGN